GAEPKVNDCTTFTEGLLIKAWKDVRGKDFLTWTLDLHNKWVIVGQTGATRFSTMVAAETADMVLPSVYVGVPPGGGPPSPGSDAIAPSPWTLVQGFENDQSSPDWGTGHSYIIVDTYPAPGSNRNLDKVLILESNKPPYDDGPAFQKIADLDDVTDFNPPRDWWNADNVPTWGETKTRHPYLMVARLKVYDLRWVRSEERRVGKEGRAGGESHDVEEKH